MGSVFRTQARGKELAVWTVGKQDPVKWMWLSKRRQRRRRPYAPGQIRGVGLNIGPCRAPCVTATWVLSCRVLFSSYTHIQQLVWGKHRATDPGKYESSPWMLRTFCSSFLSRTPETEPMIALCLFLSHKYLLRA